MRDLDDRLSCDTRGVPRLDASAELPVIVALVCSAGGLMALREILGELPSGFPATVIVLQHQAPDRPSQLSRILARWCALSVRDAEDGETLLPGTVLVVPPGKHALVTNENRIALIASGASPPNRPSADILLVSLALTAASRSIAVVLSGSGHDAATGATALHDFGGAVIAADKTSSENFAMPGAAIGRDDVVDFVVPVGEIGPLLTALVNGRAAIGREVAVG